MSPIDIKIKKIILPFLLATFSTLVAYMFLYWVMDVANILDRKVGLMFAKVWLPMLLPLIVAIGFMRSRLRLLKLSNAYVFYVVIVYMAMLEPMEYAGSFIAKAGRGLTHVSTVKEMKEGRLKRYYKVDHFKLLSEHVMYIEDKVTDGKTITYTKRIPIPMVDTFKEHRFYKLKFFYAQEYSSSIPYKDHLLYDLIGHWDDVKDSARKAFEDFVPDRDCYYERVSLSRDLQRYRGVIERTFHVKGKPEVLRPIYEPFGQRYHKDLYKLLLVLGLNITVFLIMVWVPKVDVKEYRKQVKPFHNALDGYDEHTLETRGLSQFFVPKKGSLVITPILIDLNVLLFIMLMIAGYSPYGLSTGEAYAFGANSMEAVVEKGEVWRLFMYAFLHHDIAHLVGNMLLLAAGGAIIERYIGKWAFLLLYIGAAFLGGGFSMLVSGFTVSMGASGAIMGIYGAMLGLTLLKILSGDKKVNFAVAGYVLILGVVLNVGVSIDVAAHYGGFVVGLISALIGGLIVKFTRKDTFYLDKEAEEDTLPELGDQHPMETIETRREHGIFQRRSSRRRARRTGQRRNDMASYDRSHRRPRRRIGKRNEHR